MTLKGLSKLYSDTKHPSVPEHCRPNKKFSESGANELTKSVLAWFELKHIKAYRQASEGRYLPEKRVKNVIGQSIVIGGGKFIPRNKGAKGSGDISAIIPPYGRRLEIEIKYGKDRQSDDQKKFQADIESMGGIYIIVKTWDGFIEQIKHIVK